MQSLPLDVIPIIFGFITKRTDKRQFTRTCKIYNDITKKLITKQKKLQGYIKRNYPFLLDDDNYCMEKFTFELCNDSYLNLIPKKYIVPENRIITDLLIIIGDFNMLQLAIRNGCEISVNAHDLATHLKHFDIGEFIIKYYNDDLDEYDYDDLNMCEDECDLFFV